jgi:hypothetical protein
MAFWICEKFLLVRCYKFVTKQTKWQSYNCLRLVPRLKAHVIGLINIQSAALACQTLNLYYIEICPVVRAFMVFMPIALDE